MDGKSSWVSYDNLDGCPPPYEFEKEEKKRPAKEENERKKRGKRSARRRRRGESMILIAIRMVIASRCRRGF